jgi:Ca2+/H+ antiporter
MFKRILSELASSFALCLSERMIERILFPGLHLTPGRMITPDPARAESLSVLISEAIALMAMIWLFIGALYIIAWLYRRPLRWQVPPVVMILVTVLIFAGSLSQWYTMPAP